MTIDELRLIVCDCNFPGYLFEVLRDGRGEMFLQGSYQEPDTVTGQVELQRTRRWLLSPEMNKSEIVQTVFKCLITSREHSVREWFTYRNQPTFSPHHDIDELVGVCVASKFARREV